MKKIFSICFLLIIASYSFVNAQTFEWAHNSGTGVLATGAGIVVDASGNSYVAGTFFGKCKFGNFELSGEGRDIYVVKYDVQGNVLWAKRIGGVADDFANAIAVDKNGDCYIGGSFAQNVVFGADTLHAKGMHDLYVAKLNTKGEILWARSAGGYYDDHAMTLSVDKIGNCYVGGFFKDTVWFKDVILTGKGMSFFSMYFAKYNAEGKFLWAKTLGGLDYQTPYEGLAMATDPNGISYITGFYQNEANFDSKKFINNGLYAAFTAKYNSEGKMIWVVSSTSEGSSAIGKGVAIDKKGNSYVTGTFTGTAVFDTITAATKNIAGADMFLAKYNPEGKICWLRTSTGFGSKVLYAAATDVQGNPYITGSFHDTAIFNDLILSGGSIDNIFLVKYNASGGALWSKQIGRHGGVLAKSLDIDRSGNIFLTGNFADTADLGKTRLITKPQTQDMFACKISPHQIVKEKKIADALRSEFTFLSCEIDSKSRTATVKYSIPKPNFIILSIYDLMGNTTESFIEAQHDAGMYEAKLDLKSIKEGGEYYFRLQSGKDKQTKKMELK